MDNQIKKEKKPVGYWTRERCENEVSKFEYISDMNKEIPHLYHIIKVNGWLDLIEHLKMKRAKNNYWNNYNHCRDVALLFNTRSEFHDKYSSAFKYISKNKWFELLSHMTDKVAQYPCGYLDKSNCHKHALMYTSLKLFKQNCPTAYTKIMTNGWGDEMISHLSLTGEHIPRLVYLYQFTDNSIYVGITNNRNSRKGSHLKSGPVHDHIKKTGLTPLYSEFTEYIDALEARKLEGWYVDQYKLQGYNVLNTAKPGGLGGSTIKWTFEECERVSQEVSSRSELQKKYSGAYKSCKINGWLDQLLPLITVKKKRFNIWNDYEFTKLEALKYDCKSEFQKNSLAAYTKAYDMGWLNEFFPKNKKTGRVIWTLEKVIEASKSFNSKASFRKGNSAAHSAAKKNKWLDLIFPKVIKKEINDITFEEISEYINVHNLKNRSSLKYKNSLFYEATIINNWLDMFFPEKEEVDFEKVYNIGITFKNRFEFQKKNYTLYEKALKNNWLDDIFPPKDYTLLEKQAIELFKVHHNIKKVAKILKVAPVTISSWIKNDQSNSR